MKILANFFSYAFICTAVFAWTTTAFGQFNSFFDGSCTIDGVTTPIDAELMQPEVSVFSCVEVGVPFSGGLASVQFNFNEGDCSNLGVSAEWNVVSTPEEVATWGITTLAGLSPPFPAVPSPPTLVENYGTHRGSQDTISISIGSLFSDGPVITRVIGAGMTWQDTIEIVSDRDVVIALPLHASGSVLAAESFGTAATEGFASLGITGTAAGQAVDACVSVTSVSVIPEQDSIDVTELIQVPLTAGVNTISIDLTAMGMARSTAQGAGLITGSATAGVDFNNTLNFGRFTASDGGPLPPGLVIRSTTTDLVYEDTTKQSLLGDVNQDGSVDLLDVQPFVDLLTDGGFQVEADINGDGLVDLLDVAPFVELLSGA